MRKWMLTICQAKVKRAYFLLKFCKEKLHSTEKDIEKIMKDFSENL
jgi:exonuclease VII small subunit